MEQERTREEPFEMYLTKGKVWLLAGQYPALRDNGETVSGSSQRRYSCATPGGVPLCEVFDTNVIEYMMRSTAAWFISSGEGLPSANIEYALMTEEQSVPAHKVEDGDILVFCFPSNKKYIWYFAMIGKLQEGFVSRMNAIQIDGTYELRLFQPDSHFYEETVKRLMNNTCR